MCTTKHPGQGAGICITVARALTLEGGPEKSLVLEGGSQRGIASALEDILLLQDNGPPWGVGGGLF